MGSGIGSVRANGERDSASVTSASLRSLQAVLMINDASGLCGCQPDAVVNTKQIRRPTQNERGWTLEYEVEGSSTS